MKLLTALAVSLFLASPGQEGDTKRITKRVTFGTPDLIRLTADVYLRNEGAETPFLVLFHDASSGRTEYREIAPGLGRKGFDSMAVDLRAGSTAKRVNNRTAKQAVLKTVNTSMADAEIDVITSLEYARKTYPDRKIVALGCSYSASLALRVAGTHPQLVDGVVAFSPGEFFEPFDRSATWVLEAVGTIACPVFVTSARAERPEWQAIFEAVPDERKTAFIPPGRGIHGVEVLVKDGAAGTAVWAELVKFLRRPLGAAPAPVEPLKPSGSDEDEPSDEAGTD